MDTKRRVSVIINPKSGHGEGVPLYEKVRASLESNGLLKENLLCLEYTEEGGNVRLLERMAAESDVIAICGGDGTVHHVINALMRLSFNKEIGIYPIGTGNDLYRNINSVQEDILAWIDRLILSPKRVKLDIFLVNDRVYFMNYISFGFDAYVLSLYTRMVNALRGYRIFRTRLLKRTVFVFSGLYALLFYRGRVSEKAKEMRYTNIIADNLRTYAGGSLFSSSSSIDDMMIEVSFIPSKWRYMRLILSRFGLPGQRDHIISVRPPVALNFESAVPVQIDGEDYSSLFKGCNEYKITYAGALTVLV
jgi:diacylglycerol kinase family enzyme